MARYAILDKDNVILNVCEWDGETKWEPPKGTKVVLCSDTDKIFVIRKSADGEIVLPLTDAGIGDVLIEKEE